MNERGIMYDQDLSDSSESETLFRCARKLKDCYFEIHHDYQKNLRKNNHFDKELGLVLYFLDKLSLRLGEPIRDMLDAWVPYGVLTLKAYMVEVVEGFKVYLHFPVPGNKLFCAVLDLEPAAYRALCDIHPSCSQERFFSNVSFLSLELKLAEYDHELKGYHFIYFNGSRDFQEMLKYWTSEGPKYQKKNWYTMAVLCVTRDLNLQHEDGWSQASEKLEQVILQIDQKQKKVKQLKTNLQNANNEERYSFNHDVRINRLEMVIHFQISEMKRGIFQDCYERTCSYLDPRVTVAWCKKWNVAVTDIFNRNLMTKYEWALETEADFEY